VNLLPRLDAIEARIRKLPTKRFNILCCIGVIVAEVLATWLMLRV
jgi:hypothetical protein